METPVAIDPTTSSSASSTVCDNLDYVSAAYALASIARADHGATGHSPARDIIQLLVPEKGLDVTNVGPALEQMRRKGMAKRMHADGFGDTRLSCGFVEQAAQLSGRQMLSQPRPGE